MNECIFSRQCTEVICDRACPVLVETTYLLERNGIALNSPVYNVSKKTLTSMLDILSESKSGLSVVVSDNTIETSNLLTYCAICENWKGNRLQCSVYHLKLSSHLDSIQHSWSAKDTPENLEYEQIWISSAKVLIISNIDFVQFKDFQAQTLLNIIHNRMNDGLPTIVVSPKIQTLVGSGMFFSRLQAMLREAVVK